MYPVAELRTDVVIKIDELNGETYNDKTYTLKDYPYLQGEVGNLFEQLRKRIMNLKMPQSTKSIAKTTLPLS